MTYVIFSNIILLLSCGYALRCGGRWEHYGAAVMLVASIASSIPVLIEGEYGPPVFFVDTVMLVVLLWMAWRADRFWLLWAAGFHSLSVTTHIAVLVNTEIEPIAKAQALGFWSYLVLLSLVVGTRNYRHGYSTVFLLKRILPFLPQWARNILSFGVSDFHRIFPYASHGHGSRELWWRNDQALFRKFDDPFHPADFPPSFSQKGWVNRMTGPQRLGWIAAIAIGSGLGFGAILSGFYALTLLS